MTKRNPIRRVVAQVWMLCPGPNVVCMELSPALAAFSTRPVVSAQNRRPKRLVLRIVEIGVPSRTGPAFPERVSWADQMRVPGRRTTGPLAANTNCPLVCHRQNAATICFGDSNRCLCSRLRSHQLLLPSTGFCNRGNFRPNVRSFRHIPMQIGPSHPAMVPAEYKTPATITAAALFTSSPMKFGHQ